MDRQAKQISITAGGQKWVQLPHRGFSSEHWRWPDTFTALFVLNTNTNTEHSLSVSQSVSGPTPSKSVLQLRIRMPGGSDCPKAICRYVASHECLGRAVAVDTWVVVMIVHEKSTNQGIYYWKDHRRERCAPALPSRTGSQQEVCRPNCAFTASRGGSAWPLFSYKVQQLVIIVTRLGKVRVGQRAVYSRNK